MRFNRAIRFFCKTLVVYNFMRKHGTAKQVPAVTLGILDRTWSWEEFLMIRMAA